MPTIIVTLLALSLIEVNLTQAPVIVVKVQVLCEPSLRSNKLQCVLIPSHMTPVHASDKNCEIAVS